MTATERVRADLAVRMSSFPLIEPAPFLLVNVYNKTPKVCNATEDLLNRAAAKQAPRRYIGELGSLWGAL